MDHDLITARKRYQQVKELNDEIGDYELQGGALSGLAMLENIDGEYQRSIELYQEALSAYEKIGDRAEEARVLYEALWVYLDLGDINTALKYTLESIQAYQEVGSTRGIGISMIGLAAIEVLKNNPIKAIEISAAAEYLAEQEGIVNFYGANNQGISYLDKAKETLSLEEITEAQRYGRSTTLKDILQDTPNWTVLIE
jgi:tetratricopeptide (TPR) repeat protein